MRYLFKFTIIILILVFGKVYSKVDRMQNEENMILKKDKKHIVLLGASIGRHWDIFKLPERIGHYEYNFEYLHGSGSDKSKKFNVLLSRDKNKPDAVFIKQCAAYFPGDLELYKNSMIKWVKACIKQDVIPIPTTVIPVTRLHPFKHMLIDIIKRRNPFRYGSPFDNKRNNAILKYNDWIKQYCREQGLIFLNLESPLRYGDKNRYLREDFAKIDGLHINTKAYKVLDQTVFNTLSKVNWNNK